MVSSTKVHDSGSTHMRAMHTSTSKGPTRSSSGFVMTAERKARTEGPGDCSLSFLYSCVDEKSAGN